MAEYTVIKQDHEVAYSGYVDLSAFWKHMRLVMTKKGYTYFEVEHNEIVRKNGKHIYLKADSDRQLSDDIKGRLKAQVTVRNVRDVTVELDEKPRRLQEVELVLNLSTFLISDYEGRYHGTAMLFFLRRVYEKFFGVREIKKFSSLLLHDHEAVITEAKRYLNLQNY
ncbi:MAG: hypothetical protein ACMXYD_02755 [Candidatus Woesearchaeota archaeon]